MTETYTTYNTNQRANDRGKRIHWKKDEADYVRRQAAQEEADKKHRQQVLRGLNEKHESRFTFKQKAIALGAAVLFGVAVYTGVKEADRFNEAKVKDPNTTALSFAGHEAKAAAGAVVGEAQDLLGNEVEAGGTYKIRKGEHDTYQIAEDLAKKYDVSIDPRKVVSELETLNPDLENYPPQPGVVIDVPKDVMGN